MYKIISMYNMKDDLIKLNCLWNPKERRHIPNHNFTKDNFKELIKLNKNNKILLCSDIINKHNFKENDDIKYIYNYRVFDVKLDYLYLPLTKNEIETELNKFDNETDGGFID
jgi:hypothetical protein